jgi:hypothetical protein
MALDPEQRAALLALRVRLQPFREGLRQLGEQLETAIIGEEAVELAVSERLGRPAKDGDVITPADDFRAEQIVAQCWGKFD